MAKYPVQLIGELINHSFGRARRAWEARDLSAYQKLAKLQADLGANFLTVNIDGTQALRIRQEEMLAFLPDLVPALHEATSLPLSFDNPSAIYHQVALTHYQRDHSGQPIVNSLAASRQNLDEMIAIVKEYDTKVIVMASERFTSRGSAPCTHAQEIYETAKDFVDRLRTQANRSNDEIIVDPGLAPISADTYGLVNMGLDAMRLIRADDDLAGIHLSVGLTNFSFGLPSAIRHGVESAYIALGMAAGLDFVLGNPEKNLTPLPPSDDYVRVVSEALDDGRPKDGETQEEAGFRQSMKIMELFDNVQS